MATATAAKRTRTKAKSAARSAKAKAGSKEAGPAYGGISSASVEKATGCGWDRWLHALDHSGAAEMSHAEIAALIQKRWKVSGWWAQMVTVGYEQARGRRRKHETKTGFSVGASRTIDAPVAATWRAFADELERARWLPAARWTVTTSTRQKALRGRWEDDGTRVEAMFSVKGPGRSTVAVQHSKIASERDAKALKAWWGKRLDALRGMLEGR